MTKNIEEVERRDASRYNGEPLRWTSNAQLVRAASPLGRSKWHWNPRNALAH
ncbi:hypothetical protein [Nostoc sp.]|uniref:hypothetical protein n=1 Tax=Nostoc sp. TaxID=1180 RepID=UPI002FF4E027